MTVFFCIIWPNIGQTHFYKTMTIKPGIIYNLYDQMCPHCTDYKVGQYLKNLANIENLGQYRKNDKKEADYFSGLTIIKELISYSTSCGNLVSSIGPQQEGRGPIQQNNV